MFDSMKWLSGFLIVGTTLFFSCKSSETTPLEKLSADYLALQTGTSAQTPTGLAIRADSVWVSICPANANCFAPNSATVLLRLSKDTQSQTVRLFTWIPNYNRRHLNDVTDSTSVEFAGQRYKVILRDGRYPNGSSTGIINKGEAIVQVSLL